MNDDRVSINELEALAVMVGMKLWGYKVAGKKFMIQCDNNTTVLAINSGRAANPFMQQILRELCYLLALNDVQMHAVFIPGKVNRICDSLSRWMFGKKYRERFQKITTGLQTREVMVRSQLFSFIHKW